MEKNNQELRVKEIQPPQEGYVHNRTEPEIESNPNHGGLRVKEHGKFPLAESHPQHPDRIAERFAERKRISEQLAGLGNPRERK